MFTIKNFPLRRHQLNENLHLYQLKYLTMFSHSKGCYSTIAFLCFHSMSIDEQERKYILLAVNFIFKALL